MTDDLVKRLRTRQGNEHQTADLDALEAADLIEELEKRAMVLEDYIRGLLTVVDDLEKVLDQFRGRIRELEGMK